MKTGDNKNADYSKFDNVESDVLEAFLKADFNSPESEQLEPEAVMYILDLLAKRRQDEEPSENAKAALDNFYENYYPLLEDEQLLFDFYDDAELHVSQAAPAKPDWRHKLIKPWRRFASAVAVLMLLLFGGSMTAYALGYDPFAVFVSWGDESGWPEKPPVTQDLIDSMSVYNKYVKLVPKWLPAGYRAGELTVNDYGHHLFVTADFNKKSGNDLDKIYINYNALGHWDNKPAILSPEMQAIQSLYEMKFGSIVRYSLNNIDYYILGNDGRRAIKWQTGKYEGNIVGPFSLEEATKMINSISAK